MVKAISTVPDLDVAKLRRFCDRRVPARLRHQIRLEVELRGKSVTLIECRPAPGGAHWSRLKVAQFRYQGDGTWSLHWADRNNRWHKVEDVDDALPMEVLLEELEDDPSGVFWG